MTQAPQVVWQRSESEQATIIARARPDVRVLRARGMIRLFLPPQVLWQRVAIAGVAGEGRREVQTVRRSAEPIVRQTDNMTKAPQVVWQTPTRRYHAVGLLVR